MILWDGRALARRKAGEDFGKEIEAERCQVTSPEFTGRVIRPDRDVALRGDRPAIDSVVEPVHRAASEGLAEPDGPFDRRTASVAREQARVVAENAEAGAEPCFAADEVVAVRGDNEVDTTGAHAVHRLRTERASGDQWQFLVESEDVELI